MKRVATEQFDIEHDSTYDSLVKITATRLGTGDLTTGAEWYFGYGFRDHKPVLLGYVTAAGLDNRNDNALPDVTATSVDANFRTLYVRQTFRTPGQPDQFQGRDFRWDGNRFVPDEPAINPRADAAP